jgi:hypothetical protein
MGTVDHLSHERRLHQCLRALHARGWQQRLVPLAQHMAQRHLVRACGEDGPRLRHLDLAVLREALSDLLRQEWEAGYLVYQLVFEGAQPSTVAAERGVSCAVLVELLRDAVDELAVTYEYVANASVGESVAERVRAALTRKRG